MRNSAVYFVLIFLLACGQQARKPDNLIPREHFVDLMVEMHLVEASINQRFVKVADSTDKSFGWYRYLLDSHSISRADFDSTYNYYLRQPEEMNKVFEQVEQKLKDMAAELEANEEKYLNEESKDKSVFGKDASVVN